MPNSDFSDKRFQRTVSQLAKLSSTRSVIRALPTTRARPTIPGVVGVGAVGAGGGVASPFTETDANERTYHPLPRTITSTDGVFTLEVRDIETLDMTDANANDVQFIFGQPTD